VDISVKDRARAAIVVMSFPGLKVVERVTAERPIEFPYVPGLLAFREIPSILDAFARLSTRPDLLLVDGHGYAHPRRFGIACHLGVELDLPSIGCGKSLFVGEHAEPGRRRGSRTPLRREGETIGSVVRTRDGVRPIYVSVGHRIGLAAAVRIVLACCARYRLPEPIRFADMLAGSGV
jgi:deoxyribonuclease V